MERPIVRQTQPQQVSTETREVTGSEAEELLRKYGYGDSQSTTRIEPVNNQKDLTFEEMVKQHEEKEKALRAKRNNPKPITFGGDQYDQHTKHMESDGMGFTIQISTDMKLPKY